MAKNELNVDDLIFNEHQSEPDCLELPLSRQTFMLAALSVAAIGLVILGRGGFLNFFKGDFYASRAGANVNKQVDLPAPRGIILDRFGKPLTENASSFTAFVNAAEILKNLSDSEVLISQLAEIFGISSEELKTTIGRADLESKTFIPIARNISLSQAIQLRSLNLSSVQIEDDYVRKYPDGPAFSHVLGYVGVSEEDNSIVGKSGLEAQYDNVLRGADGEFIIYRDVNGKPLDQKVAREPVTGSNLTTTIDADLQRFFYQRLKSGLAGLGREAGVGLAIDPRNGEILALISLPGFDNNQVSKYLKASNQPLFNRAISGLYTPGSTIKTMVALAALKEKIVDPSFQIYSAGFIEIPNPYDKDRPSRFLDWKPHGWVDLHSALARSSNVYFYEVGGGFEGLKGLGIDRLIGYWKKFLLGEKTGVDLPEENSGFLPNPEEKEKRTGQIWRIGDTYNVTIGQGDLLVTPIQLLNFIASIANGGKIFRPHLIGNGEPDVLLDYSDWKDELGNVQEGMRDTVRKYYGTANMLAAMPVSAAAKTGSSQVANNTKINAFFVGYSPAGTSAEEGPPKIAVLVLIENAREGSLNAVPIAKDVLEWYYYNRLK